MSRSNHHDRDRRPQPREPSLLAPLPAHRLFPAARLSAFLPALRAEVRRRGRRRATCSLLAHRLLPAACLSALFPATCSPLPATCLSYRPTIYQLVAVKNRPKQYAVFSRVEKSKWLGISHLQTFYSFAVAAKFGLCHAARLASHPVGARLRVLCVASSASRLVCRDPTSLSGASPAIRPPPGAFCERISGRQH